MTGMKFSTMATLGPILGGKFEVRKIVYNVTAVPLTFTAKPSDLYRIVCHA